MKRYAPLLLLALLLLGGVIYVARKSGDRQFDNTPTLRREDRIPYGTFLARQMLPKLFPGATVYNDRAVPGHSDSVSRYSDKQALLFMGYYIDADDDEVDDLLEFAAHGNYVYFVGAGFSDNLCKALHIDARQSMSDDADSLTVALETPRFASRSFHCPGTDISSLLIRNNADSTVLLGTRNGGQPNFLQFTVGKGAIFVHASPLAFSNYFLLQPGNEQYLAAALSVLPPDLKRIGWSEYYISKNSSGDEKEPNWLGILLRYKAFSWALGLLLALLLLYALSEMRRRQRWIPPYERPTNDSLDFVKTVGRLYYDKRDHHDLASKMITYFLDHVRQQYKIQTTVLDEEFARRLEARSGYPRGELDHLLALIADIRALESTSAKQLIQLHQQLENYYQHG
ncbi:DUF4350 domain-containing protein [Flaviaesturariibacter terrae]